MKLPKLTKKRVLWGIAILTVSIPCIIFPIAFHLTTRGLESHSDPVASHEEALHYFQKIETEESTLPLNPVGRSILLSHNQKTEYCIVLYHGLTNCPQQFRKLGTLLYEQGYNVFIPRLPRHGMADRKSSNLSDLTAEELRKFTDESVDMAHGFGDRVVVAGLSAGGVLGAYVAQNRPDVEQVVVIAPALGFGRLPREWLNKVAFVLMPLLPNLDTDRFSNTDDALPHCYPGFSSRSLGQLMRLGGATLRAAAKKKAAVQNITLITSRSDTAINEFITWNLITLWRAKGLQKLDTFDFPESAGVEHDMIDPDKKAQKTDLVYPVIIGYLPLRAPQSSLSSMPPGN